MQINQHLRGKGGWLGVDFGTVLDLADSLSPSLFCESFVNLLDTSAIDALALAISFHVLVRSAVAGALLAGFAPRFLL